MTLMPSNHNRMWQETTPKASDGTGSLKREVLTWVQAETSNDGSGIMPR